MEEERTWRYRLLRVLQILISVTLAAYIFVNYPRNEGYLNHTYTIVNPEEYSVSDRLLGENAYNIETTNCFNEDGKSRYASQTIKADCEGKLVFFQSKYLDTVLKNRAEHSDPQKVRKALITASNLGIRCIGAPKPDAQMRDDSSRVWREMEDWLQLCQWHEGLSTNDQKELADINSVTTEHRTEFVNGSSNMPMIIVSSLLGCIFSYIAVEILYRLATYISYGRIRNIP